MATKKQIIIPIVILATGIAAMAVFSSMKKPPEEKAEVDNTPIVAVSEISVTPMTLEVNSYGMVTPKYETELIAQVNGEIVELSDTFLRGGFVKKDQLLARIDPNDYQAALIDAQAAMATARAALETEVAQGKVAEREWKQITDTSPTELSLRKPQLAQELARVKAAQASVLRAERNLERTEIRAPYDAMINSRNIGLGSFVGVGSKIGHVLATETAEIRLPVADNQLEFLANHGVNAKVNLLGKYAGKDMQWSATIKRNEGVIDNKSRMGYLVAELNDPYQLKSNAEQKITPLRFGSYVNAKIVGNSIAQATSVPRHLVIDGKVAILDSDSRLHYAVIDIVRQQGSHVIVSNGLQNGDQLIVSALDYPVDGMKLALASDALQLEEKDQETEQGETQMANNIESGE
ncbi:efflux RND transporter periplasmic adaptor subunit [Colwellia psychrerythraea]|uniref:Efflux transporter, RND family, MFP subunit n=1 Tax=Colwellia psychrerythraea TaxID=28229 RepID=A0A099KZH7_COLPS|nr:efflux RND transporter periplasmic adaptor subunit [Colwellia psychrerythraea]KGJ95262.1 efflux transporter, RND family, MFP subunit [Colwellia psychrerythraea]